MSLSLRAPFGLMDAALLKALHLIPSRLHPWPGPGFLPSAVCASVHLCLPVYLPTCPRGPLPSLLQPAARSPAISRVCVHREDPGALCCGREPLSHSGAGLPHAVPQPHPRGGHQKSQGPPRHHPQQGLLEAAPGPGPQAAEATGGVRGQREGGRSGQACGSLDPSWRVEAQGTGWRRPREPVLS